MIHLHGTYNLVGQKRRYTSEFSPLVVPYNYLESFQEKKDLVPIL